MYGAEHSRRKVDVEEALYDSRGDPEKESLVEVGVERFDRSDRLWDQPSCCWWHVIHNSPFRRGVEGNHCCPSISLNIDTELSSGNSELAVV
jgi:hypothetical protein